MPGWVLIFFNYMHRIDLNTHHIHGLRQPTRGVNAQAFTLLSIQKKSAIAIKLLSCYQVTCYYMYSTLELVLDDQEND